MECDLTLAQQRTLVCVCVSMCAHSHVCVCVRYQYIFSDHEAAMTFLSLSTQRHWTVHHGECLLRGLVELSELGVFIETSWSSLSWVCLLRPRGAV